MVLATSHLWRSTTSVDTLMAFTLIFVNVMYPLLLFPMPWWEYLPSGKSFRTLTFLIYKGHKGRKIDNLIYRVLKQLFKDIFFFQAISIHQISFPFFSKICGCKQHQITLLLSEGLLGFWGPCLPFFSSSEPWAVRVPEVLPEAQILPRPCALSKEMCTSQLC